MLYEKNIRNNKTDIKKKKHFMNKNEKNVKKVIKSHPA
jgi:hypothetical protein